ncbi:TPA: GGDEF domain-containing protein [Serratia rubidaea]|nr:GGDEF domain-containing protein [Serratia rubidaea]HDJ1450871.1 GGDEF domain-containing protein [Serratia rubidaea]HDJ2774033.1 GGDEF domain-containing protein [Serratia rubidaea]
MKVKYLIYFFTFLLTASFTIAICDEWTEAKKQYNDSAWNLNKTLHSEEVSSAFQNTLRLHTVKRLSLVNPELKPALWQESERETRNNIRQIRRYVNSDALQHLTTQQKIDIRSMLNLLEKMLDNDTQQLAPMNNAIRNLFNINSAYYITQSSMDYYSYTYESRILNADAFLFLESIRLNNQLNITLTEIIDQLVDITLNGQNDKESYLKTIQLTGVLNVLSSRLLFMEMVYSDPQISRIINQLLEKLSPQQTDGLAGELYDSMAHGKAFDAARIYAYVKEMDQLSQQLFQRSFELEIAKCRKQMYQSQTAINGLFAFAWLLALFLLMPTLIFCSNISRWLTKTQSNIQRLSHGDMAIDAPEVFYSQELIAITEAINQLKQYHLEKVRLEQEKHALITELEASSYLDPLTNIYNRRRFFRDAEQLPDAGYPLAFCLIDIDNFKALNDTYGHNIGDLALVAFADLLRHAFRAEDIFCRYGGEEFAILLHHCALPDARMALEKLRHKVQRLRLPVPDGQPVRFTISCGIAAVASPRQLQTAIKLADEALYFCKKNGKDRVAINDGSSCR